MELKYVFLVKLVILITHFWMFPSLCNKVRNLELATFMILDFYLPHEFFLFVYIVGMNFTFLETTSIKKS